MAFLTDEGVAKIIHYIHDELNNTVKKGEQITLPNDLVHTTDLNIYAKKTEIPEPQDLSKYALTSTLNNYATIASLSNYATNAELEEIAAKVSGVYHFRGSVANLEELQAIQNPEEGDVYNIESTGMNAAWTGSIWDDFGTIVDLSGYVRSEDVQAITNSQLNAILYSGKSAVVNTVDAINAMINNDEEEVNITLNKNMSSISTIIIPEGKKVIVDMGGNNVVSTGTAFYANGGELILKNGNLTSSSNPTIQAENGAIITIDGANITSSRHNGINATEAEIIVNSGSITSQEAGIAGFKDSIITINGGTITGIDNGGLMGNGSPAGSDHDGTNMNIIMNGGTIIGHITSAGYQACGVYIPNTGSFIMNGGKIISDGAGIVMRGGLVHIGSNAEVQGNGTSGFVGKAGDSKINVGSYGIVYDATSNYPGVDTLELIIDNGTTITGTDGDISTILPEGKTANITDNR